MRASSQRKQAIETSLNPDVSRASAVEPDQTTRANRHGTLRRVRPRLIIRDPQVDGEAQAPIGTPIRRQTASRADVWSLPAMLDHDAGIDRSHGPTDHTTSITELLGDLRAGRREAFD